MNKPNFFIVGLGKSASTSIHNYLAQHRQICMSSIKEPNFFGSDLIRGKKTLSLSENEYLALFLNAEGKKIIGESSISYLSSERAAQQIYNFNPNSKILILLRDPVEQMFSRYEHNYRSKLDPENEDSFEQALAMEKQRIKEFPLKCKDSDSIIMNVTFYRKNILDLPERISQYSNLFGADKVKIILYEDFKSDPQGVFKELLQFLEVDDSFVPVFKKFNNNTKVRYPILRAILFSAPVRFLRSKISMKFLPNLGKLADEFTTVQVKKGEIKEDTRQALKKELLPCVEELEKILKRDLSIYK